MRQHAIFCFKLSFSGLERSARMLTCCVFSSWSRRKAGFMAITRKRNSSDPSGADGPNACELSIVALQHTPSLLQESWMLQATMSADLGARLGHLCLSHPCGLCMRRRAAQNTCLTGEEGNLICPSHQTERRLSARSEANKRRAFGSYKGEKRDTPTKSVCADLHQVDMRIWSGWSNGNFCFLACFGA